MLICSLFVGLNSYFKTIYYMISGFYISQLKAGSWTASFSQWENTTGRTTSTVPLPACCKSYLNLCSSKLDNPKLGWGQSYDTRSTYSFVASQNSTNIIEVKEKHPNQMGRSTLMFLSFGNGNATKIHLNFFFSIGYLASVLSPLTASLLEVSSLGTHSLRQLAGTGQEGKIWIL